MSEETPLNPEQTTPEASAEQNVPEVEVTEVTEVQAEATEAPASEPLPELTLGSGAPEEGASEDQLGPAVAPTVRGRIDKYGVAIGTGRRKTSVARVRIKQGGGKIQINGRHFEDYFRIDRDRNFVMAPLKAVEADGKVDIEIRVNGGGITGQTGAVVLGIARALHALDESNHHALAEGGFLTRDSRMVERKKYGFKKARRSFQFSKR